LWDDDGKAYLVHAYAYSRAGIKNALRVRPMSPDGSRLLGEGEVAFNDPKRHPTMEGPKFLKKDDWYYILAPAGGVATGWQVALRSRHVYGPYEDKVVLEQGGTSINGPHQGALVDLPNGEWWFIHFQDVDVYGRIVHLQPVQWKDGWPLIGLDADGNGIGEPVLLSRKPVGNGESRPSTLQASDEFDSPKLGLQWQWQANHSDTWYSLTASKGRLRLFAQFAPEADLSKAPAVLQQKFPARTFAVETLMDFTPGQTGDEAGIAVTGRECASLAVRSAMQHRQFVSRMNGAETILGDAPLQPVKLRVDVNNVGQCFFSYDAGDGFVRLSEAFQALKGVWIGAKVGLYCLRPQNEMPAGYADFDYFRFE
jgi:beta-xylosidase